MQRNDLVIKSLFQFLHLVSQNKCPPGVVLDLSSVKLGNAKTVSLAQALMSGQCPNEININLEGALLGDAGAQALAQALMDDRCPRGLRLNLAGTSPRGFKYFFAVLTSKKFPQDFELNLNNVGIASKEEEETIIQLLLSNTSLKQLTISSASNSFHSTLNIMLLRNRLISSYPELEMIIKAISAKYGFYRSETSSPLSLRVLASMAVNANQLSIAPLPTELQDYVDILEKVSNQIAEEMGHSAYFLKSQDEINRAKLDDILTMLSQHKFVLHKNIINKKEDKKEIPSKSKSAEKIDTLIRNFLINFPPNNDNLLTDEKFSILANDIRRILKSKLHSTRGLFGLGARDNSTASLYLSIIVKLDLASISRLESITKRLKPK